MKVTKGYFRDSNIELLRIVAMLFIIGNHLSGHGIMHVLSDSCKYVFWNTGIETNKVFAAFLRPGGEIGVAIFFIISGYFCINRSKGSLKKIYLQLLFYGIIFCILYIFIRLLYNIESVTSIGSIKIILKSIIVPISGGDYWFVTVYALIVLCIPVINGYFCRLNKKSFRFVLIAIWLLWYIVALTGNIFYQLQKGLFFYLIGAYIKKHKSQQRKCNSSIALVAFVLMWCIGGITHYLTATYGINDPGSIRIEILDLFRQGIVVPICAVSLLYVFLSFDIGSNQKINNISSTCFGVFLIHDSYIFRNVMWNVIGIEKAYENNLFPVIVWFVIVSIFVVCSIIDFCRKIWIEPLMYKYFDKLVNRLKLLF